MPWQLLAARLTGHGRNTEDAMGTVLNSVIIDKAQTILQDVAGVRWNEAELLGWMNDGQREVIIYKPNANTVSAKVQLVKGTKQTIPVDGVQLVDVPRNLTAAGDPGRAIRLTERETLDAYQPEWHTTTPSATAKHYMYSLADPKRFWVYPPQPATGMGYIEIVYGAVPGDMTLGAAITLDDVYQAALLDYVLYRAFSKDTEFAVNGTNRAATHYNAFLSAVGGKAKVEAGASPNQTAPASLNAQPSSA